MRWFPIGLEIIGALSLLLIGFVAVWAIHNTTSEKVNAAKPKDVLFILNWGGISTNQDFRVISSYQSARSLTGDHLDYYCVELTRFEVSDYERNDWHDGPEQNPLLAEAIELAVNDARQHGDCFRLQTKQTRRP